MKSGAVAVLPLKRKMRRTAPTLGERAKKIPTDKSRDFYEWWCRGDWFQTNPQSSWVLPGISE
jgi:hypothetical protein